MCSHARSLARPPRGVSTVDDDNDWYRRTTIWVRVNGKTNGGSYIRKTTTVSTRNKALMNPSRKMKTIFKPNFPIAQQDSFTVTSGFRENFHNFLSNSRAVNQNQTTKI